MNVMTFSWKKYLQIFWRIFWFQNKEFRTTNSDFIFILSECKRSCPEKKYIEKKYECAIKLRATLAMLCMSQNLYLSMKEGSLFCFVVMRSTKPVCFRLCPWCLSKALDKEGCMGLVLCHLDLRCKSS
jgi:hypothetical protein